MTAPSWPSWRVGRSQPHNIYMDDVHRLVVLGEPTDAAELAGDVVASLNADARRGFVTGTDGPDQGDPAAWAMREHDGRLTAATTDPRRAESWGTGPWVDDHGRRRERTTTVVGLYLRAPGAVAAAPPGDEDIDAATAEVSDAVTHENPESMRSVELRIADGWRFVRPAPPAGHEDEAAVERVIRAWLIEQEVDHLLCLTGDNGPRGLARAALAAARGPRPVEDEAAVERAIDQHIAALVRTPDHAYRDMLHALYQAGLSGQVPATVHPPGPQYPAPGASS